MGCNTFGVSGHFFIFRFDLNALIGVAVCYVELYVTYP